MANASMGAVTVAAQCRGCGANFEYSKSGAGRPRRFCSAACKYAARHHRVGTATCQTCGKEYHARYVAAGFCSIECRRYPDRRLYETPADRNAAHRHRRRARIRQSPWERFNKGEIYERDGWRCGICSKPVSKRLAYPHPMSATLDHVIPLSKGGGHTRSNVQCAHFMCNSLKADRGGGQLNIGI